MSQLRSRKTHKSTVNALTAFVCGRHKKIERLLTKFDLNLANVYLIETYGRMFELNVVIDSIELETFALNSGFAIELLEGRSPHLIQEKTDIL